MPLSPRHEQIPSRLFNPINRGYKIMLVTSIIYYSSFYFIFHYHYKPYMLEASSVLQAPPPKLCKLSPTERISVKQMGRTCNLKMGGCQNYGPFWGTLNIRCHTITRIQKGTITLTTSHIVKPHKERKTAVLHSIPKTTCRCPLWTMYPPLTNCYSFTSATSM